MSGKTLESIQKLFLPCHDRIIVTGGGSGIGRAVAISLAALGSTVYILGRNISKLEHTAQLCSDAPGKIIPVSCDITDPASIETTFTQIESDGFAQALFHSAASHTLGLAKDLTAESFQKEIESSLGGAFNVLHRWGTALINAKQEGVAVSVSSTNCSREMPGIAGPSAAKAGSDTLVRTLASEWGRYGIRLNIVGPGIFPMTGDQESELVATTGSYDFVENNLIKLHRVGEDDEIVGPVLFLLSKAASYMTGARLEVDGGMRLLPGLNALLNPS